MGVLAALTGLTDLQLQSNGLASLPQLHSLLRLPRLRALSIEDNPINSLVLLQPYAVFRWAAGADSRAPGLRWGGGGGGSSAAAAHAPPALRTPLLSTLLRRLTGLMSFNRQLVRKADKQAARRMFGQLDAAIAGSMVRSMLLLLGSLQQLALAAALALAGCPGCTAGAARACCGEHDSPPASSHAQPLDSALCASAGCVAWRARRSACMLDACPALQVQPGQRAVLAASGLPASILDMAVAQRDAASAASLEPAATEAGGAAAVAAALALALTRAADAASPQQPGAGQAPAGPLPAVQALLANTAGTVGVSGKHQRMGEEFVATLVAQAGAVQAQLRQLDAGWRGASEQALAEGWAGKYNVS
jgi:hypothetical protein